ncbi:MAG: hypothetical protein R3E02_04730 [Blastomonas sp.]
MTIIGLQKARKKRPKGPIILGLLAVVLVGFVVLLYVKGGEQSQERVEKPVAIPAGAA